MLDSSKLEDYILSHSTPESELRATLGRVAHLRLVRPRMLSGHLQGNFLRLLVQLMNARKVLELGTYSGYAAHCMAEMEDFIRKYIEQAPYGNRIHLHIGDAIELLPQLLSQHQFDIVYMDANKRQYVEYYNLIIPHLKSGALIIADNTLWDGKVIEPVKDNDTQTKSILAFNKLVQDDERVENLILPMRDGLSLIRVK